MPFLSATITISIATKFSRQLNSATKSLTRIPSKYRTQALEKARKVLTDYLHFTRSLPFHYAENIANNSLYSLTDAVSRIDPYHNPTFSKKFLNFLSYNPINEFEFFYESIGLSRSEICGFLPSDKFFFSEDGSALNVAFLLSEFGFPWNRIGLLFKEEASIFGKDLSELSERLCRIKSYGFSNTVVIGVCLVFPSVLVGNCNWGGAIDALFDDLKRVFLDSELVNLVDENVDALYNVCCKIRLFYDMGCEKGKVGVLLGRSKSILVEFSEEVMVHQMDFFCRLGAGKEDVAWLILRCPEILSFDLDTPEISVLKILKQFGMSTKELRVVNVRYPYLLGTNKMANLPHVMRALNLYEWFFDKIQNENHYFLSNYFISKTDKDLDEEFREGSERIRTRHMLLKLDFMHGIGFGQNALTLNILAHLHGTGNELQERFDFLLSLGVDYSKLCRIISLSPKILNQKPEIIKKKMVFLCQEMGLSLHYLNVFPAILNFHLENRIKPRYRFNIWLTKRLQQKGFHMKKYSIPSIVATSDKKFIAHLLHIQPAAPKQWLECFSCNKPGNSCQET